MYLTILLDLVRWFTIDHKLLLFICNGTNDCVTLCLVCLCHEKCSNFLQRLYLSLKLERELSKIVSTYLCITFTSCNKQQAMNDFMQTIF